MQMWVTDKAWTLHSLVRICPVFRVFMVKQGNVPLSGLLGTLSLKGRNKEGVTGD